MKAKTKKPPVPGSEALERALGTSQARALAAAHQARAMERLLSNAPRRTEQLRGPAINQA